MSSDPEKPTQPPQHSNSKRAHSPHPLARHPASVSPAASCRRAPGDGKSEFCLDISVWWQGQGYWVKVKVVYNIPALDAAPWAPGAHPSQAVRPAISASLQGPLSKSQEACVVHPAMPARGPRSRPEDWEPASAHAVSPPASSLHLVVAGAQSCTRPREGAGPLGHTAGFVAQRGRGGVQWGLGPRECAGVHRGYGVQRAWGTGCSQP